jgi:hypothetical protein
MITRAPTRLARASRSSRDGAVPTQELYELLKKEGVPYEPNTGSDCEVLIPLYVKFGLEKACSLLRGPDPRGNQIYGPVTASARWREGATELTQVCSRSSSTTNGRGFMERLETTSALHHYTWAEGATGRSGSRRR